MSQKVRNRIIWCAVLLAVVLFFVLRAVFSKDTVVPGDAKIAYSTDYGRYLTEVPDKNRPDAVIEIAADSYASYEEEGKAATPEIRENFEGHTGKSILTSEIADITYKFSVAEAGLYELSLDYYPVEGKNSEIQRAFFLDGEQPYTELNIVQFTRIWTTNVAKEAFDAGLTHVTWKKDNQGNDMKPTSIEIPEWVTSYLYDNNGYITEPLSFYLTAGEHEIRIQSKREPMLLGGLKLSNQKESLSYADQKAEWDKAGAANTSGITVVIEGEDAVKTSSQTLYPKQDQSSAAVSDHSARYLLNNTIGGTSWDKAGQWIEWQFEVPEDGYYEIALFDKQNFMRGIYVSRQITIDGEVPFREMENHGFYYESDWHLDPIADADGNPYKYYITKGKHTLRMEVVLGDFSETIAEVQDSVSKLNEIYRKVIRIIGVSPDTYRDYQIEATLPTIVQEMTEVRDELNDAIYSLRKAVGRTSDKETVLITMRDQLD